MSRAVFLLTATLLALAGCADSPAEPEPAAELAVQLTAVAAASTGVERDGGPVVQCNVEFRAQTTGDEAARANWTGGVVRYYLGAFPAAIDSLDLAPVEVQQAFGEQFGAGQTREARFGIVSAIPFALEMELRYRVQGEQADRRVTAPRASCGMPAGTLSGPAPIVSGVSVVAPEGDLEPGDTLRVTWTATGSPSVWETGVEVEGAFTTLQRVAGLDRTSITQTALVVVPPTARLDESFGVRVYAIDPWARGAASVPWLSPPLVDRTPPTVYAVSTSPLNDLRAPALKGQYGSVDSMRIFAWAGDNQGLSYLVYEFRPQGVRDSVFLPDLPGPLMEGIPIPLPPGLLGATELRVHFRDRAGNRSREFTSAPGAVRVYPVREVPVHSVQVPERPEAVVVDPARNRLYAIVVNRQELRVHSLPGMGLERTVPLPFSATALELTADGDSLLISAGHFGHIVVMDVNAAAAPPARVLPGVAQVHGIQIASTGRAIALAGMTDGRTSLLEVDLGAGTQRVVAAELTLPIPSAGLARSRDRRRMVLGAGCAFDVPTERVGPCGTMALDGGVGPISGDVTGERWGHAFTVFDAALQPVLRVDNTLAQYLVGIVPVAGGDTYVAHRRGLVRVRPDGTIVERLAAPTLAYLRLSDDGGLMTAWAFAADGPHHIHVLDLP